MCIRDRLPVVNGIPVSTSLCGTAAVVRTVDQPPGDGIAAASESVPVRHGDGDRQPTGNVSAGPQPRQSRRDGTRRTTSRRVSDKDNPDSSSSGSRGTDRTRHADRRRPPRKKNNRESDGDSSNNSDESNDRKRDDVSKSGRRGRDKDNPSDREDKDDKEGRSRRKDKRDGRRSPSPDDSPSPTRRREAPYYRKHWIKPKEFDGHTSFESFLVSFENAARFNEWISKEKLAFLSASLTGPAVQLLWGNKKFTYKGLVKELKEKFGETGMEERYQAELRCRRRREGETIRDLAQDIHRLMTVSYTHLTLPTILRV